MNALRGKTLPTSPWPASEETGWPELTAFFARVQERIGRDLEQAVGLSLADYEALAAAGPEGQVRITDLARRAGLSCGGGSRLVQRLVERGLMARCPCPTDRRVSYACLTPEGEALLARAQAVCRQAVAQLYGDRLSEEEKRLLAHLVGRLGGEDGDHSS